MMALAWIDFFVVRVVPLGRPIWVPFLLASLMPWLMRLCRSVTSFSDCSKAALICSSASAMRKLLINSMFPLKKLSTASLPVWTDILNRLLFVESKTEVLMSGSLRKMR